jgi:hypothetical protein
MRTRDIILCIPFLLIFLISCNKLESGSGVKIIFLHHSTGDVIWNGHQASLFSKAAGKINDNLADFVSPKPRLLKLFENYNQENSKTYLISDLIFPKAKPYGWNNYPYDYYNIWVKNGGEKPFMKEPTLEMLTKEYQVIIFKHCFPVSNIRPDNDSPSADSDHRTISNYKLQYSKLRDKMHQFPASKFILFTGATQVKSNTDSTQAERAREFFKWVINEWDLPDDNIFIWDLYGLQTEGDLYFKKEYSVSPVNSHPNNSFAEKAVNLLFNRIIDVIDNNGICTELSGEIIQETE